MTTKTEAASKVRLVLQSVKDQLAMPAGAKVNEATTRAHFLNPLLDALGYRSIQDILFEFYLPDGKTFLDYRLVVGGKPRVGVEAKALGVPIADAHAAQAISYAAVLGDEWAVVTNAREWRLYHAFAQAPLAEKMILKLDLVGWESDAQFDSVFEQLWLISKDSFESGDGPASWLTSKKLDQVLRTILADPSSPEVKYLRVKLEQRGIASSADQVASWLKAHLESPAAVGKPGTAVSPPYSVGGVSANPKTIATPVEPYSTPSPLSPSAGNGFWIIPSGKQAGYSAADHLKSWLGKGFWGFGPSTPGRKAIQPGDWACFYAATSHEILAYAQIAGSIDVPVTQDEWPGPGDPQTIVYKVPLKNIAWLATPTVLDAPTRATLDAFNGKESGSGWSWLVQTTHRVTEADFKRLTRQ